ncbi:MAG: aspartate/glutamate racemase family protein, partial [Pseudomonadota bacterium]
MGAPRIVLIHALDSSIEPITSAFAQGWPEARLVNLMDDSLSVDRAAEGCLTPAMTARFDALTRYAVSTGADGILFTCSAFHEAIYAARANVDIPVLTPDEAMMEKALVAGSKITMLATFEPTLATSKAAMEQIAGAAGRQVEVHSVHVPEALAALQGGDPQAHHAK